LLNVPVEQPLTLVTRIDSISVASLLAQLDTTGHPDRQSIRSAELTVSARRLGVTVHAPTTTRSSRCSSRRAFPPFRPSATECRARAVRSRRGLSPRQCGGAPLCQNGGFFSDRQLALNLSFPIFDGFRVRSNVELAQAQYRVAELELQQQRETVSLEVARARAELRRSRAAFAATQQSSSEAQEAFQLAQLRFTRGLTTQLEVSDAQLALLIAQSFEARATYDLFLASADLARALGRPIPLPPMSTTPSAPR
jgi:hypothetical protein